MEKIKNRSEVDPQLSWDLTKLYKNAEEWEKEFATLEEKLEKFLAYKGRLSESAQTLFDAYKASDDFEIVLDRLYTYAHLKSDEDTADSVNKSRLDRISEKAAVFSAKCAWFSPELLAMDEAKFESFRRDRVLAFYKRSLDNEARYRPHILSAPEEKRTELAKMIVSGELSVREAEKLASKIGKEQKEKAPKKKDSFPKDKFYREMQVAMTEELGRPFKITENEKGGTIELPFYSKEELADFCERILKKKM